MVDKEELEEVSSFALPTRMGDIVGDPKRPRMFVLVVADAEGKGVQDGRLEHVGIGHTAKEATHTYVHGSFKQLVLDEIETSEDDPEALAFWKWMLRRIDVDWDIEWEEVWSDVASYLQDGCSFMTTLVSMPIGSGGSAIDTFCDDYVIDHHQNFYGETLMKIYRTEFSDSVPTGRELLRAQEVE